MPTAFSYVRFSSAGQRRGTSEARQDESPEPWCRANGYTLDTSLRLRDLGRSGYHGHNVSRGALGAFLHLVEDGKIERGSALVIEHLDRLTRQDPLAAMEMVIKIISAGIDIITLMDGERYNRTRLSTDLGAQIKLQFTLFQSHSESTKISRRTTYAWESRRKKAREGTRVNRRTPSWIEPGTNNVIEDKADVIRRIFKMTLDGIGPYTIAKTLNSEGVAPLGHGKAWVNHTVKYYLTTRTTLGEYQPNRIVEGHRVPEGASVTAYYPPVIDIDTYRRAQRTLDSRKNMRGRSNKAVNLFALILHNLYDGGRYSYKLVNTKTPTRTYTQRRLIPVNQIKGMIGAMKVSLNYDSFQESFFQLVREIDVAEIFTPTNMADKARELESLQAELHDIDGRIVAFKARAKKEKNFDTILDLVAELEGERKTTRSRIETLKSELVTSESRIFEDMRAALDDERARTRVASAIRMLIDRIDVLPIPGKKGRYNVTGYALWVEVTFHNGRKQVYLTDDQGKAIGARMIDGKATAIVPGRRRMLLASLIDQASPEWKPKLEAWLVKQ